MSLLRALLPVAGNLGDLATHRPEVLASLRELYSYPELASTRGWVRAGMISSLDGSATGPDGRSGTLGNPADLAVLSTLRSLADVVLVGAGTARAEGYQLPTPHPVLAMARLEAGQPAAPRLAVLSRDPNIAEHLGIDPEKLLVYRDGVRAAVDDLVARGMVRVLLEGGPSVLGEAVEQQAVDELCLSISPALVLGNGPRIAHTAAPIPLQHMELAHLLECDGLLLGRWLRS